MKFSLSFLLIAVFPFTINAQNVSECNDSLSFLKYYDLAEEQWDAWDSIDNYWTRNYFQSCMAENGFRLNCEDCEKAYLTIKFCIDSLGQISTYHLVKSSVCGELITAKLADCFMDYFLNIRFPTVLRNLKLQVMIGNGLKC